MESGNLTYYGSTTQALSKRKSKHKSGFKKWLGDETAQYTSSYELFKIEEPEITLVETFPCKSKEELLAREKYYIKHNECVNQKLPQRSKSEYYKDKKEDILKKREIYYNNYQDAIKEVRCEYYKANRNDILQSRSETITCACGKTITKNHLVRHQKSQSHLIIISRICNEPGKQDTI